MEFENNYEYEPFCSHPTPHWKTKVKHVATTVGIVGGIWFIAEKIKYVIDAKKSKEAPYNNYVAGTLKRRRHRRYKKK